MERITMKQARQLASLTQEKIAHEIGVSVKTYQKYESNPKNMQIEKALRFCEAVKRPIDSICFTHYTS